MRAQPQRFAGIAVVVLCALLLLPTAAIHPGGTEDDL
jgi:hypothetical protein